MRPLKEVIQALRREIEGALSIPEPGSAASFQARSVVVTLEIAIEEQAAPSELKFRVLNITSADGEGQKPAINFRGHQIRIEFERTNLKNMSTRDNGSSSVSGNAEKISTAPVPEIPRAIQLLKLMLGQPGFDNSGRAVVFRETIERLSPKQLAALMASFASDPEEVPRKKIGDTVVATARTRVTRLLKLGPGGIREEIAAMVAVFAENSSEAVLRLLSEHWKTQSDWIDSEVPGVTFTGPPLKN